jgi:hypothetical protein
MARAAYWSPSVAKKLEATRPGCQIVETNRMFDEIDHLRHDVCALAVALNDEHECAVADDDCCPYLTLISKYLP